MSFPFDTISVINTIAQTIVSLIPGLKGRTQHLSDQAATSLATQFAESLSTKVVAAYGDGTANGVIADFTYTKTLELLRGGGGVRWGGVETDINRAAIAYLGNNPPSAGVYTRGTSGVKGYLFSILYIHAWWILRNIDIDSETEFQTTIVNDLNNGTLVPAIRSARYDPEKLYVPVTGGGAVGGNSGGSGASSASILGGLDMKTILLISVALFIIVGVFKR